MTRPYVEILLYNTKSSRLESITSELKKGHSREFSEFHENMPLCAFKGSTSASSGTCT